MLEDGGMERYGRGAGKRGNKKGEREERRKNLLLQVCVRACVWNRPTQTTTCVLSTDRSSSSSSNTKRREPRTVHHDVGAVVVEDRGDVLPGEGVGRVGDQQAGLTDRAVAHNDISIRVCPGPDCRVYSSGWLPGRSRGSRSSVDTRSAFALQRMEIDERVVHVGGWRGGRRCAGRWRWIGCGGASEAAEAC